MRSFKHVNQMAAVLAILGWACVAPCSANLILNGSFETSTVYPSGPSGGIQGSLPTGLGNAIDNWNLQVANTGSTGDTKFNYWCSALWSEGTPEDQSYCILISNWWDTGSNSTKNESLLQSFLVSGGTTYTVSYWTRERNSGHPAGEVDGYISVSGGLLTAGTVLAGPGTLSGDQSASLKLSSPESTANLNWVQQSFTFTPSQGATATIKLTVPCLQGWVNASAHSYDSFFDNVSVTPVPEPSMLALLASALAGLLCYAWRKRR